MEERGRGFLGLALTDIVVIMKLLTAGEHSPKPSSYV